ncbi:hypothetical protein [Flavivirga spongiicola]|uniref:Uncharacterized protein n=1 Tax=Flavivirga spongiicola TaxID=421621 RepID=A0ABU7XYP0_9FLAO|nr:hypothetical protein [Flavivirga sp. MEBiC05379]MDO5980568.1 hypothetical protein [Flavivirga sp. MEBiC05379]
MSNYKGPGNIKELNDTLQKLWQSELSRLFEEGIKRAKNEVSPPSNDAWMFNPILEGDANTVKKKIDWNAFPKNLTTMYASKIKAWREGDKSRGNQDEYCEWEVVRDQVDNKIIRVTFTTETPDYFEFLFNNDPKLLLDIYHKHVSTKVKIGDLTSGNGKYKRINIWNTPEIINKRGVLLHMIGPNSFSAAVDLSAEATWPSVDLNGNIISDEQQLIDCRNYGDAGRHSDPHIGAEINALIRQGNIISLAAPSGLYIDNIDLTGFDVPDGLEASDLMTIVRGDQNNMLRVVFQVPKDSGFKLGDVKIDGTHIQFGGQIAEKITIRVMGIAKNTPNIAPSIDCSGTIQNPISPISFVPLALDSTRRKNVEYLLNSTEI